MISGIDNGMDNDIAKHANVNGLIRAVTTLNVEKRMLKNAKLTQLLLLSYEGFSDWSIQ